MLPFKEQVAVGMPNFDNPYQEKEGGARPAPGILAQQWASLAEMGLRLLGVHLYVHEHNALATLIGAFFRAYPHLKDIGVDKEQTTNDKDTT